MSFDLDEHDAKNLAAPVPEGCDTFFCIVLIQAQEGGRILSSAISHREANRASAISGDLVCKRAFLIFVEHRNAGPIAQQVSGTCTRTRFCV
ncbi:hypothetical protein KSB_63000 [Ktedonobacter robiniae]|uniref:Uncharacterized protein n=1 Tax=Ktedonobacter robiniae TaxID=2778365 RepID=A0ABQ3UYP9_9CHLR|nr:hypothetical protein KSB_63000 [Ktedonobacter robiniae]